MKVILNVDIPALGEEGDVKEVKDGYARNYLIPKKFAFPYTPHYQHLFQSRKAKIEARKEEKRRQALSLKERLDGREFEFTMLAGENGKLHGSLTAAAIAERLASEGMPVEKRQIHIPGHTLKAVGTYELKVQLLERESATIKVTIKPQLQK